MKSIQPLLLIRKPGFHSTLDILEIEHSLECRVTAEEEGRKGGSVYSACHISLSSLKTIKREKGKGKVFSGVSQISFLPLISHTTFAETGYVSLCSISLLPSVLFGIYQYLWRLMEMTKTGTKGSSVNLLHMTYGKRGEMFSCTTVQIWEGNGFSRL